MSWVIAAYGVTAAFIVVYAAKLHARIRHLRSRHGR